MPSSRQPDRKDPPAGTAPGEMAEAERRALRGRLLMAARHESMAAFLPGYVHDLNNALVGIQSHADLCGLQLGADHPLQENVSYLKQSTLRAVQLVAGLNRLLESRPAGRQWHDLRQLGRETVDLVAPGLFRGIQLEGHWGETPLPVEVDAMDFRQAMLQLLRNAMAAVGHKGMIQVQTFRLDRIPQGMAVWGQPWAGPLACLAVTDTGQGLAPDELKRIWDRGDWPGVGGTGLGLPVVCRFVRDHAGAVTAESVSGRGSSFKLWLPLGDLAAGLV